MSLSYVTKIRGYQGHLIRATEIRGYQEHLIRVTEIRGYQGHLIRITKICGYQPLSILKKAVQNGASRIDPTDQTL